MQNQPRNPYASIRPTPRKKDNLLEYWAVVMKHYLVVLLVTLVAVTISVIITQRQPQLYRATATIEILPPWMASTNESGFQAHFLSDDRYLTTQLSKLRMKTVIEQAISNSNLTSRKEFQGKTADEIVKMAAGRVEVVARRNQYLVDVSVTGENKSVLRHLCNAIVENFRLMQRSESKNQRDKVREELETTIDNARSTQAFLRLEKNAALRQAGFNEQTFHAAEEATRDRMKRYQDEQDTIELLKIEQQGTYAHFKDAITKGDEAVLTLVDHPFNQRNRGIAELTDQIALLRDRQRALAKQHSAGARDPEFLRLEGEVQGAISQRERKTMLTVKQFVNTFEEYQKRLEELDQRRLAIQSQLEQNAAIKNEIDLKNAEIDRQQQTIDEANRDRERLAAIAEKETDSVRVSQHAVEPPAPFSPNKPMNFTLGLVLGLVSGVALAFLLDYLDDTIRNKDELIELTPDVPLLGIVPNIEARKSEVQKKDLYAYNKPKSTISEAYRGVRTALTLSAAGSKQKVLLLTSAGPREGKTTTSINLATVLGYSGAKTLLIDADLRKPRIHKSFDRPNTTGLTTAIVGGGDPCDHVLKTDIDRVDLMPSGPIPPNPSELLGRPRMREVLDRLREVYDQIIIDTPPIGAVTDAAVLATVVDGVILVVHAGKTRKLVVGRGLEQLHQINANLAGVILNNLRLGRGRYYPGYYHYYYYYTSYYGADERSVRGKGKKGKKDKAAARSSEPAPAPDTEA